MSFSRKNSEIVVKDKEVNLVYNLLSNEFELFYHNKCFCNHRVIFEEERYTINIYSPIGERFYGLGEKAVKFDRRGLRLRILNKDPSVYRMGDDPLYVNIPFLLIAGKRFSYGFF
ncbi:MAG TPA: hypothetical protein ENG40_04035 [Thermoprotei archaeon]|nr:hypothetical protein [Thermoprotei archaeon]